MKDEHDQLVHHLGRLQAIRHQITDARRQLHEKVDQQLDSMPAAIEHVEAHLARGKGGGPLGHRALRTMLVERSRLHRLIHARDADEP